MVCDNHIQIDWTTIYKIKQIGVMEKLIPQFNGMESKQSPQSDRMIKHQDGLNVVLPNTFKSLNNENITWLLLLYNQFLRSQADFYK